MVDEADEAGTANYMALLRFKDPRRTFQAFKKTGAQKAKLPWWKVFWLATLAGNYIGISCAFFLMVGGSVANVDEGVQLLVVGAFGLPMSLTLIRICGAELLTANSCFLAIAVFEGEATLFGMFHNMFFSFWGNLAGCLTIMELVHACGLFTEGFLPTTYAIHFSETKAFVGWGEAVGRAFLCNWLVCLAVWQSVAALDVASLIASVYFPVMVFVATGYDHLVANMFIIPFGMRMGSDVSVRRYVGHRLIPTFVGNFCSSVFMVAFTYSMCYGTLPLSIKAKLLILSKQVRPTKSVEMQPSIDVVLEHVHNAHVIDHCVKDAGENDIQPVMYQE